MALIVVVVVITAGWLIYSQKDRLISRIASLTSSEKPPVFQAKIEPLPRPPERTEPQQGAPLNQKQPSGSAASGRDRIRAEQPPATSSRSTSGQQKRASQMATLKPQVRTPKSQSSATSSTTGSPGAKADDSGRRETRPPAMATPEKSTPGAVPAARSYPRLDNGKLKLQAIAWSNVAAERIAVINDRIVREGESVEDYSINQIRQEDVVVNDGAQSWQLEFGLR